MPLTIAAIDVGSNAIRLAIAKVEPRGVIDVIHVAREAVRLGQDVFGTSRISSETMNTALVAFRRFRELLNKYGVRHVKAVATSAVREAENADRLVGIVARKYGIDLQVIDPSEEARLVHVAIKDSVLWGAKTMTSAISLNSPTITNTPSICCRQDQSQVCHRVVCC